MAIDTAIDPEPPLAEFETTTPLLPEETFWQKHNRYLEMPISLLLSMFLMVLAFAVFALLMLYAIGPRPEKPMPEILMLPDGGDSDSGLGNPDAGESGADLERAQATTPLEPLTPADVRPLELPDVRTQVTNSEMPDLEVSSAEPQESSFGALADAVQKKLLPGTRGTKDGAGKSGDGVGAGERGIGADMTKARSLRWIMKFETAGGRDYLDQLNALGAVILVPVPGEPGEFYLFRDLKNPRPGTKATDTDMANFANQVQFSDGDRDTLAKLSPALGLNFTAREFYAVFPKGLENELAEKERAYRGWRPEEIAATRFQVVKTGGAYKLAVTQQTRRNR